MKDGFIKGFIHKYFESFIMLRRIIRSIPQMQKIYMESALSQRRSVHPNPFARYGKKGYSQSDEDGIIFEIIRRLKIDKGTFIEFGPGDGLENNTVSLMSMGWRGVWIGNKNLAIDVSKSKRLSYIKNFVNRNNIEKIYKESLKILGKKTVNIISTDLDGNDFYFCEKTLSFGIKPDVFIVEYNGYLPPPMRFVMPYDENFVWQGDEYFGASLASYMDLFKKFDYGLVCCNGATGANAFFVKKEFMRKFPEVPDDISDIYASFMPIHVSKASDKLSKKLVQTLIEGD